VDNISIIVFLITSLSLLLGAVWLIWSTATSEPMKNYRTGTWTTQVKRPVHPEMKDVEPGTELMGVNFQQKTECNLQEYKDLQARIEELRIELEGEDEDEDEDGDIIVRV
jgi:G:T-mismatch repair DNA endonuclease (very short patch repair protein)